MINTEKLTFGDKLTVDVGGQVVSANYLRRRWRWINVKLYTDDGYFTKWISRSRILSRGWQPW